MFCFSEESSFSSCKKLVNKRRCKNYSNSIVLRDATSLDMCASACENQAAGAIGCCEWQHDWKLCSWYTDQRQIQPVEGDEYRSAVLCSSKYNEVVVYNCTDLTTLGPILKLKFRFSSLGPCARLYSDAYYLGRKQDLDEGEGDIHDRNNQVSSIRVKQGCTLTAYRDMGYKGMILSLSEDLKWLEKENDNISSYRCICDGKNYF